MQIFPLVSVFNITQYYLIYDEAIFIYSVQILFIMDFLYFYCTKILHKIVFTLSIEFLNVPWKLVMQANDLIYSSNGHIPGMVNNQTTHF